MVASNVSWARVSATAMEREPHTMLHNMLCIVHRCITRFGVDLCASLAHIASCTLVFLGSDAWLFAPRNRLLSLPVLLLLLLEDLESLVAVDLVDFLVLLHFYIKHGGGRLHARARRGVCYLILSIL